MAFLSGLVALGTAALGAAASNSASKRAANAATQASETNNALQRDIYGKNTANISPFMQRGNAAGATYNALLGLGGDQAGAEAAFDTYRGSTGYDFRMGQGVEAINQNNVTNGLLRSGKSLKDLTAFGQGMASDEFGNYLGYLGNQQQTGLSGANALAGVGSNYAGAVSANNNNAANQVGNAALIQGNNTNAFLNTAGGVLANWAGQRQSSYAPSAQTPGFGGPMPGVSYGGAWGRY